MKRKSPRPLLRRADRLFWVLLSRLWSAWREALVIVKPETVIAWHRKGFRLLWTWKSRRRKGGRPLVPREVRELIRRMSRENPLWGAPRVQGELMKLGIKISEATVSKYMTRLPKPPSQTWRTFFRNHAGCLASIDFFVLPTATFRLLFVFVVLQHERRQIAHFGVTANPTAAWVVQQITEAFPWDTSPRYMIRVERAIGSIRRECLDHVIVLNERHLRRILASYFNDYHRSRTHLSLGKDTPVGRPVQPAGGGKIVAFPQVGGLHHRYERLAA
jgi:hypothetical protein